MPLPKSTPNSFRSTVIRLLAAQKFCGRIRTRRSEYQRQATAWPRGDGDLYGLLHGRLVDDRLAEHDLDRLPGADGAAVEWIDRGVGFVGRGDGREALDFLRLPAGQVHDREAVPVPGVELQGIRGGPGGTVRARGAGDRRSAGFGLQHHVLDHPVDGLDRGQRGRVDVPGAVGRCHPEFDGLHDRRDQAGDVAHRRRRFRGQFAVRPDRAGGDADSAGTDGEADPGHGQHLAGTSTARALALPSCPSCIPQLHFPHCKSPAPRLSSRTCAQGMFQSPKPSS